MSLTNYLIAFGKKPLPGFLHQLRTLAKQDGVNIIGAIVVPGPGCYNLAIRIAENEQFVNALCMALQPAKWEITPDTIPDDEFTMTLE